jgi:hypothetical protein
MGRIQYLLRSRRRGMAGLPELTSSSTHSTLSSRQGSSSSALPNGHDERIGTQSRAGVDLAPNARSYGEFVRSGLLARLGRSVLPDAQPLDRVRRTPTIFGARNSLNSFRFNARWSSGVKSFPSLRSWKPEADSSPQVRAPVVAAPPRYEISRSAGVST